MIVHHEFKVGSVGYRLVGPSWIDECPPDAVVEWTDVDVLGVKKWSPTTATDAVTLRCVTRELLRLHRKDNGSALPATKPMVYVLPGLHQEPDAFRIVYFADSQRLVLEDSYSDALDVRHWKLLCEWKGGNPQSVLHVLIIELMRLVFGNIEAA